MELLPSVTPEMNLPLTPGPRSQVTVLFVGAADEDWRALHGIFECTNWTVHRVKDLTEAAELLERIPVAVLVTDEQLPGGNTWLDLLRLTSACGHARVIVTAACHDVSLWAQVLNLGGYDVLTKPFDRAEVIRLVSLTWLNWRDERQRSGRGTSAPH